MYGTHEFKYTVGINYDDIRPEGERPTLAQRYKAGRHSVGVAMGTATQILLQGKIWRAWMKRIVAEAMAYQSMFKRLGFTV